MKCCEVKRDFYTYLDGQLAAPREHNLYLHLSSCYECQQDFKEARKVHHLLEDSCNALEPPPDLMGEVLERIKERNMAGQQVVSAEEVAEQMNPPRSRAVWAKYLYPALRRGWMVAGLLVLLAVGALLLNNSSANIAVREELTGGKKSAGNAEIRDTGGREIGLAVPGDAGEEREGPENNRSSQGTEEQGEEPGPAPGNGDYSGTNKGDDPSGSGESSADEELLTEDKGQSSGRFFASGENETAIPEGSFEIAGGKGTVNLFPLIRESGSDSMKPVLAPGSDELLYLSQSGEGEGYYNVYRSDLDGSNRKLLGKGKGVAVSGGYGNVDWHPAGRSFAYATQANGHLEILVRDLSGSERNLTPAGEGKDISKYWAYWPRWSSRGELVFLTDRFGNVDLMLVDREGNSRVLTKSPTRELYPTWSPDGEMLAYFRSSDGEDGNRVYVMKRDGSGERALTSPIAGDFLVPSWAPNGKKLAINVGISEPRPGARQKGIWVVNADGTGLQKLTSTGGGRLVEWAPDGRKIAFTDAAGLLYVLALPSGKNPDATIIPVTREPGSGGSIDVRWSRDSKQLLLDWKKPGDAHRGIWVANINMPDATVQ